MVEYDKGPAGYKKYQEWFSTRKVGVYNHGIPDLEEELEGLREDIENTNWQGLEPDERVAVANIAMDTAKAIAVVSVENNGMRPRKGVDIVMNTSTMLFNKMLGTKDPFEEVRFSDPFGDIDL